MINKINEVIKNSNIVLKGKEKQVKLVLCNILANGHTLIEDAPGVGKTTLVKYIGKALNLNISRIQFTNDLLPSDIIGTSIFNKNTGGFDFHKGPLFGEFILADELNRAPPKTQSSLLQAMEERTVSIEGNHFKLPDFFIVMATQNPHMQIGTFDLPESQLDRFSMKIEMGYADKESTIELLKNNDSHANLDKVEAMLSPKEILELQSSIKDIHVEDSLLETVFNILELTRHKNEYIPLSNRCGIDLVNVSKAWAYLAGRDYVIPDDLFEIFPYVAGHRLVHPENSEIVYEHKLSQEIIQKL
jgi:MoxR-like ATPase